MYVRQINKGEMFAWYYHSRNTLEILCLQEKKGQISECKLKATSVKARLEELKTLQDAEEQLLQEEAKEMEQLMVSGTGKNLAGIGFC